MTPNDVREAVARQLAPAGHADDIVITDCPLGMVSEWTLYLPKADAAIAAHLSALTAMGLVEVPVGKVVTSHDEGVLDEVSATNADFSIARSGRSQWTIEIKTAEKAMNFRLWCDVGSEIKALQPNSAAPPLSRRPQTRPHRPPRRTPQMSEGKTVVRWVVWHPAAWNAAWTFADHADALRQQAEREASIVCIKGWRCTRIEEAAE